MFRSTRSWIALLLVCVIGFAGCDDDEQFNNPIIGTILDNVSVDPQFTTLTSALERTGQANLLDVPTVRLTLFAPTDAAFSAAGINLATLTDDQLSQILAYHLVVGAVVRGGELMEGDSLQNSANTTGPNNANLPLLLNRSGSTITVNNDVTLGTPAAEYVNGVVYTIDRVLMPPTVADRARLDGRFTTLLAALERVGLTDALTGEGTFTVFAPTDAAFTAAGINPGAVSDDALRDLLRYHLLGTEMVTADIPAGTSFATTLNTTGPDTTALSLLLQAAGQDVNVNGNADVITANLLASNGVVHVINDVLSPQRIVDFVTTAASTDALATALTDANLVGTLDVGGPFTVFGPVNSAFAAAADTTAALTANQVVDVMRYHVLTGNTRSTDLSAGVYSTILDQSLIIDRGADGQEAPVIITADSMRVGIITTDVQATNGVIHLIDKVLLPDLD